MNDKLMDTQELSEIRKLIGAEEKPGKPSPTGPVAQAARPPSTEYALGDILAEVGDAAGKKTGNHPLVRPEAAQRPPSPSAGAPTQSTVRLSRSTGRVQQKTDRLPQVTGRIPRVPGTDPREVEQSLRATAEEQARKLAAMTEEDEDEVRPSRRERRRAEKERREAQERARDREDEIEIRDPRIAQRACKRRAKNLARRSILVLIFALLTTYITVAGGMGLPLPTMLQYTEHAYLTLMALMLSQFIAMFAGLDVVGSGLYNLFTGKADRGSLVMCALVASLLHGMTIIVFPWEGWLPYNAVSIWLLYAQMQEEKARLSGRYRVYKAATLGDRPTGVYAHRDDRDHVRRAVKYRMRDRATFLREVERTDQVDFFERIYAPLALIASLIFALVSSVGTQRPTQFFWAFSAILSISAPFGVLLAFGAPYRNISRKLLAEGAAIASARQAGRLRRVKEAVLRDGDIFPAGSITVEEIRNLGGYSAEKLLAYAAALTDGQGLEMGRVLGESLREQYGRPVRATNVTHYESGGMSADIGADSVLVGTASFLSKLGIRLPEHGGMDNVVFVVINSQIAGEIALAYHPTAQTFGAIHLLTRLKIRPVIAAQDFNISPAMVESMFEMKHGTMGAVDPTRIEEMSSAQYAEKDNVGAILSKDGAMPFALVQQAADTLIGAMRSNLLIGSIAGVCGMLLMFYLAYHGAYAAAEPKNVLLYLLLWYVPVFIISLATRRNN